MQKVLNPLFFQELDSSLVEDSSMMDEKSSIKVPGKVIIKELKIGDGNQARKVTCSVHRDVAFKAVKPEPIDDCEEYFENNFVEPKCKVLPAERPVSNFMKIGRTAGPILSNRKMPNRRHTSYFCPHCEHRFGSIFEKLIHTRKLACYS